MGCYWKGGAILQASINGCQIEYDIQHNPESQGLPVLFLHGWGCDRGTFSFILSDMAQTATVIGMDFPGHGHSSDTPSAWGVEDFADQVYQLLIDNDIHRVNVIAHSFGGRVALYLATKYPQLIHRMVITGGAGIKKPVTETSRKRTARFKQYHALLDKLAHWPLLGNTAKSMQTKLRNRYGSADYVKLNENMRKTFVRVITEDLYPLLAKVDVSTLLIWGSADTETPLWMGETMEKEIPDAGLVVFEGASHYAFLEQWQRFVLIVKQFFMEENA